jgi:Flp pilus assembly pilin Flp
MRSEGTVLNRLLHDDGGQDLIEYGLLLGLIAIGLVALMPDLFARVTDAFGDWSDDIYELWIPDPPAA